MGLPLPFDDTDSVRDFQALWLRQPEGDDRDTRLIAGLRALDDQAWAELYDAHHSQIWRYTYSRTGSHDAADDLAAQVFAEALASISSFEYRGKPVLAWLYRIARNQTGKYLRARRHEEPIALDLPAPALDDRLNSLAVAEAMRRLTKHQREIVALRFFAGYSTREIAAALSKSETAVYSQEARALAAMRRLLAPESKNLPPPPGEMGPSSGIDLPGR